MGWGKFNSELNEKRRTQLAKQGENSFEKDTRINIRISRRDLEALQKKAMKEGLPYYQSLVSRVLYKYVSGGLKDITAEKTKERA